MFIYSFIECREEYISSINFLQTDKKVKRSKPKKKYRSREVSPSWRPKYGCGRLHWIMRDHGSHTRKGKNSRRNRSKAPSCKLMTNGRLSHTVKERHVIKYK